MSPISSFKILILSSIDRRIITIVIELIHRVVGDITFVK